MAIERGIQVIDGSHLFASIAEVWRDHDELKHHKLKIDVLTRCMQAGWSNYTGPVIRSIYYFKKDDKRLREMLDIPTTRVPGAKNHWQINECAQGIPSIPSSELEKLDPKYRDYVRRSEKGLDIELACDSLQLVADQRVDAIVFLVNDRDYLPLFRAIQRLGANTYLTALDGRQDIQKDLANLADMYLTFEGNLNEIFGYTPPVAEIGG